MNAVAPSVTGIARINFTAANTVTNLTGGKDGQRVSITAVNAGSTIVHNLSHIILSGGVNMSMGVYDTLTLENRYGVWYEVGRMTE